MQSMTTRRAPKPSENLDTNALLLQLREELRALLAPKSSGKTFEELAATFLPRKLQKLGSAHDFKARFRNHLIPAFALETDQTLKPSGVEEYLLGLVRQGYSPQTANHIRDAGRQLIEDAIGNGEWIGSNPFAKAPKIPIPERDYDVLSQDEAARLLVSVPLRWRSLFALVLYLGPRRKTIFHVRRNDVDLTTGLISFNVTKTKKKIKAIPIPDELVPHLRRALRDSRGEWLFRNRFGGQHKPSKSLNRVLRAAFLAAGIRREGRLPAITFHGLRRVCSVLHQEAGCHPSIVSRVLGHSQANLVLFGNAPDNMTQKAYSPFSESYIRSQLNRLTFKKRK